MDRNKAIEISNTIHVLRPFEDIVTRQTRYAVLPPPDPIRESCIWKEPLFNTEAENVKEVGEKFRAYHTFGHPSLFKPSLTEALEAIPEELVGKFNAISIEYQGFNYDNSKHRSMVTAYSVDIKTY